MELMTKQGYKQTEVGLIPEDWEIDTLKNVLRVIGGGTFKSRDRVADGIKWLKIANVGIRRIKWNEIDYLPFHFTQEYKPFLLEESDIVMALTRPILRNKLKISRLKGTDVPCLLNQRVGKIEALEGFYIDWIYHVLQTYNTINGLLDSMAGTDPPNLSNKGIYNIQIPIPPTLTEQKAIATALSDVDALIASLEQTITKKKAIKQGAMQQLLTPNEKWKKTCLVELADNKKSQFDDGDWVESEYIISQGVRLIQTGNIGIGQFKDKGNKKYISEDSFDKLNCKEVLEGDLLVCRLAEPAGRACIMPNIGEYKVITSVDVSIFRGDPIVVNRMFLSQLFTTNSWFQKVIEKVGGTTHKRISRGALGKIEIKIPPTLEEQKTNYYQSNS